MKIYSKLLLIVLLFSFTACQQNLISDEPSDESVELRAATDCNDWDAFTGSAYWSQGAALPPHDPPCCFNVEIFLPQVDVATPAPLTPAPAGMEVCFEFDYQLCVAADMDIERCTICTTVDDNGEAQICVPSDWYTTDFGFVIHLGNGGTGSGGYCHQVNAVPGC